MRCLPERVTWMLRKTSRSVCLFAILACRLARGQGPLPTLYLIGDSTVHNGSGNGANGQWGWGEPLADYFDSSKIRVVNRARGDAAAGPS